jgi:predicted Zn-ribbon and HTH transcriptional regulator
MDLLLVYCNKFFMDNNNWKYLVVIMTTKFICNECGRVHYHVEPNKCVDCKSDNFGIEEVEEPCIHDSYSPSDDNRVTIYTSDKSYSYIYKPMKCDLCGKEIYEKYKFIGVYDKVEE